ncbi:MAG: galactosyldiacylglycerol synthase [Gemmatimonadota bacterium]|nr:MAG: galactosyldiacylglycerol synthase [Gemmatimonadota bacterium]
MIKLYDNSTQSLLGEITKEQLEFLVDHLEETSVEDQDYYIDAHTVQTLSDAGADAELVDMLRRGLGDRHGYEVRWADS